MRLVRGSRRLLAGWAGLFTVAVTACNGAPPSRGFHSRQLVATRDPTLEFISYGDHIAYYTTGNSADGTQVFWSVDVDSAEVENLGTQFRVAPPPDGSSGPPPRQLNCRVDYSATGVTMLVTDSATGVTTTIGPLKTYSGCPTIADPYLAVVKIDEQGKGRLWAGPYAQLQAAPVDLIIDDRPAVDVQTGSAPRRAVTVLAAPGAAPDSRGILTIDLGSFAITTVIPPVLDGGAWAAGVASQGPLESNGLVAAPVLVNWPTDSPAATYFGYHRLMSDGSDVVFVGPLASNAAGEVALFPASPRLERAMVWDQAGRLTNILAWQQAMAADPTATELVLWDDWSGRVTTCATPRIAGGAVLVGPDRRQFAFTSDIAGDHDDGGLGPLLVISTTDADPCRLVASDWAHAVAFSSDALMWLDESTPGTTTLWVSAPDGTGARAAGSGNVRKPHFVSPDQLELTLGGDLVWVDVRDDPINLHYVAEKVFGEVRDGLPWVTTGFDFSAQDGTGTLGVINRDSGDKRRISPSVSRYMFVPASPEIDVVYLVRGRNPSPEDGVWAATITASDLL